MASQIDAQHIYRQAVARHKCVQNKIYHIFAVFLLYLFPFYTFLNHMIFSNFSYNYVNKTKSLYMNIK